MQATNAIQLVLSLFAAAAIASAARGAEANQPLPNIIIILSDDHGYADLGVHGCRDIATPAIDSIATGGVRCTNGYVSAPQCSPTRAGLMTGRYQQRFGHEHNAAHPDSSLPLDETTLAQRLKDHGYATGLVGKWHLGTQEQHHPLNRGFQEFFGFLGGANPYLPQGPRGVVPRILRNREPTDEKEYLTDAFGREAVSFIDRHQQHPFFLYLAFNATHGPMQAADKYLEQVQSIEDPRRRTYAAMTLAMDAAVGRVLEKLRIAGLEENTLIFFCNDNGGPTSVNASDNSPLRGVKGEVREGGIRVPFLVRWPARLKAGTVYDLPVIQLDITATALAAAGVALENAQLDGVDLLPYLTTEKPEPPHEALYWRFSFPPNQPDRYKWAIRKGDWKLFSDLNGNRNRDAEMPESDLKLVHLPTDIAETQDLARQHPDKVQELYQSWQAWNSQLQKPPTERAERAGGKRKKAKRGER